MNAPEATQPRNHGVPVRGTVNPGVNARVGLLPPNDTTIARSPTEAGVLTFSVIRFRKTTGACSVHVRVAIDPDAADQVPADFFPGGTYFDTLVTFDSGETSQPVAMALELGPAPARALSGMIELYDPIGCEIEALRGRFTFTVEAGEGPGVGDAIVSLALPGGTALAPVASEAVEVTLDIARSGETSTSCSVGWQVEGAGSGDQLAAADFATLAQPAFHPDYTTAWELVRAAGDGGTITQNSAYLDVQADVTSGNNTALLSKARYSGLTIVQFEYLPLNTITNDAGGVFWLLYCLQGLGGSWPADISAWASNAYSPSDTHYAGKAKGLRLSGDTKTPVTANLDEIRCRGILPDGTVGDNIEPTAQPKVAFSRSAYNKVRAVIDPAAGRIDAYVFIGGAATPIVTSFVSPTITSLLSGSWNVVLFFSDQLHARVKNAKIWSVASALPSGTASFASSDVAESASFYLASRQSPPAADKVGRLRLVNPVDCLISSSAGSIDVRMPGNSTPPPPIGSFPFGPWRKMPGIPTSGPKRREVTTRAQFNTAYAAAQPGDFILWPRGASADISGDLNLNRSFPANGEPVYITTDYEGDDPDAFIRFYGGDIILNGAQRNVLNGFRYDGGMVEREGRIQFRNAKLNQIERFVAFDVFQQLNTNVSTSGGYAGQFIQALGNPVQNNLIAFWEYSHCAAGFFDATGDARPTQFLISHGHIKDQYGFGKFLLPGRNPEHGMHDINTRVQYILDTGSTRGKNTTVNGRPAPRGDFCEFKFPGFHVYRVTQLLDGDTQDSQWKIRQGRIAAGPYNTHGAGPTRGNIFEEILIICRPGGRRILWSARGAYHRWVNCLATELVGDALPSLTSRLAGCTFKAYGAQSYGKTFPETADEPSGNNRQCSAYGLQLGNVRGFNIGADWDDSTHTYPPEACVIPTTGPSRNTGVTTSGIWRNGQFGGQLVEGADATIVPPRLFPGDVGPRQWRRLFSA